MRETGENRPDENGPAEAPSRSAGTGAEHGTPSQVDEHAAMRQEVARQYADALGQRYEPPAEDVQLLDVVTLVEDRPEDGLAAGARGTVVHVHDEPERAYEVEFLDPAGRTTAVLTLRPDQLRPAVWLPGGHPPG
jgi:hypothetical protein